MPNFEEVRTVTADGRLIVPWVIQQALGLDHGGPVRFRVDNGVVTLVALEVRRPGQDQEPDAQGTDGSAPRRTDFPAELAAELKTLLDVAERDRASAQATE